MGTCLIESCGRKWEEMSDCGVVRGLGRWGTGEREGGQSGRDGLGLSVIFMPGDISFP